MNIDAYIASGVLENYCLGFCSAAEISTIEEYASIYPAVKLEIDRIRHSLEDYFQANEIKPAAKVKISLMRTIYSQNAAQDTAYPPLIDEKDQTSLMKWIAEKNILQKNIAFDNLHVEELPSTDQITNFIVFAKMGHQEEMHENFVEYLYVIKGSCVMDFEGKQKPYKAGELIVIPPHIRHIATITSSEPMIALVQRQACA